MILVFEMTCIGRVHVAFNANMLEVITTAYPDQKITMFGDAEHLRLVQDLSTEQVRTHVVFKPVEISKSFRGMPHIVSVKRFIDEMRIINRAFERSTGDQACLMVFCSATPTAILAAQLNILRFRKRLIQVIFHGNLHTITGWRTRNPFMRAADLISIFKRKYQKKTRFVLLEHGIGSVLADLVPEIRERIDILPHMLPSVKREFINQKEHEKIMRFGFIGGATKDKGFDTFVKIAKNVMQSHPHGAEFILIGNPSGGLDNLISSNIAHYDSQYLSTSENYYNAIQTLDYAIFPFKSGYYDLSPSGALLDALGCHVPVIAIKNATISKLFDEFGALGILCDSEQEALDTVTRILNDMSELTSDTIVHSMVRISQSRSIQNLASLYQKFPGIPF